MLDDDGLGKRNHNIYVIDDDDDDEDENLSNRLSTEPESTAIKGSSSGLSSSKKFNLMSRD